MTNQPAPKPAMVSREQERLWRREEKIEWAASLIEASLHRVDCLCAATRGEDFSCFQSRLTKRSRHE